MITNNKQNSISVNMFAIVAHRFCAFNTNSTLPHFKIFTGGRAKTRLPDYNIFRGSTYKNYFTSFAFYSCSTNRFASLSNFKIKLVFSLADYLLKLNPDK